MDQLGERMAYTKAPLFLESLARLIGLTPSFRNARLKRENGSDSPGVFRLVLKTPPLLPLIKY